MLLRLTWSDPEGTEHALVATGPVARIGRNETAELCIRDARVSGTHARLVRRGEAWFFEDLASRNGSLIERDGQQQVARPNVPLPLQPGDRLLLGDRVAPVSIDVSVASLSASAAAPEATVVASEAIAARPDALQLLDPPTLRSLFRLLEDLAEPSEPSEVMGRVADTVGARFEGLVELRVLLRQPGGEIRTVFQRNIEGAGDAPPAPPAALLDQAMRGGELLLLRPDGRQTPSRGPHRARHATVVLAPLRAGAEALGVLCVRAHRATFGPPQLAWLGIVSLHLAASLARAHRYRRLLDTESQLLEENAHLRAAVALRRPIIGRSEALQRALTQLAQVATTDTAVLLLGETGTGKELAARYVHAHSRRHAGPLLPLNCAALPAQLLESELFGHCRGAFTGATRDHRGIFEAAEGGTVLLDEIGEMPLELQVKLLRVLQEHEVRPVGSNRTRSVDVRVVAASNRDLRAEAEAGRFRQDLYYRLAVFPVCLPPLRDRSGDVDLLAEHFREAFSARHGRWIPGFSLEALEQLRAYPWPGNVRELEHAVERAVIVTPDGEPVHREHLSPEITGAPADGPAGAAAELPRGRLREVMEQLERRVVLRELEEHGGNRTHTAAALGISRQALQVKLRRWDLISE